ncbi:unnamed protein product, partial [Prorocentrum cordatum]
GVDFTRLDNIEKIRCILAFIRHHSWDITTLTELLHGDWTANLIVEELLIVIHKRVAVVLSPAARAAHMASDSKVFRFSNLVMGVCLKLPNMDREILYCSVYMLSGLIAEERAAQWSNMLKLHESLKDTQFAVIFQEDWNAHRGRNTIADDTCLGTFTLSAATTQSGQAGVKFIQDAGLRCVDYFLPCERRGTWRHNVNGLWYELDYTLTSGILSKAFRDMKTFSTGFTDHVVKQYTLQEHKQQFQDRVRHHTAQLLGAGQPRNRDEEFPENEASQHFFVDGSGDPLGQEAGWGAALFLGEAGMRARERLPEHLCPDPAAIWHGPVQENTQALDFLGALSAANNTGEMSAMCVVLLAVIKEGPSTASMTIYYDSTYAANM